MTLYPQSTLQVQGPSFLFTSVPARQGSAVPGPPSGSGAVADPEGGANRPHSRAVCFYGFLSTGWFGTGSSGSQCTLLQFPPRATEGAPGEIPHCPPAKSRTSPSAEEIPLVHRSARPATRKGNGSLEYFKI